MFQKIDAEEKIEKARKRAERKAEKQAKKQAKQAEKAKKQAEQQKEAKQGEDKFSAKAFVIPFFVAIILTGIIYGMIMHQVNSTEGKIPVVYITKSVDKNTKINADDYNNTFTLKYVDQDLIPATVYQSLDELPSDGLYIKTDMDKNQILLPENFTTDDLTMAKYESGHETTSISATSFANAVNGTIRKGDIVDIYSRPSSADAVTELYGQDLYVEAAYTANGTECKNPEDVATSLTIWVTPDEVSDINRAVALGNIQVYVQHN